MQLTVTPAALPIPAETFAFWSAEQVGDGGDGGLDGSLADVAEAHYQRSPSFMLKLTGFFDRDPALDVPALGGHCPAKAS